MKFRETSVHLSKTKSKDVVILSLTFDKGIRLSFGYRKLIRMIVNVSEMPFQAS